MKCANCDADAFYIYRLTLEKEILYCKKHLPSFLEDRRKAGLLPTTDTYNNLVEEGKKNFSTVTSELPAEEAPVAEPKTTPTPTLKKTTAKKAATKNANNS